MAWGLRDAKKAAEGETEEEKRAREDEERRKKSMRAGGYVRGGREARQQAMDEADE